MKMAMNKYTDKAPLPDRFKIGNNMVCDKLQIVNEFNKYFANIGLNLSKNVPATNKHYTEFLNRPHKHSMFLDPITPVELRKITTKLKRKTTQGHDQISTNLMKESIDYILIPLALYSTTRKGQRYTLLLDGGLIKGWGLKGQLAPHCVP